jgi:hypothetical protein
MIDDPNALIDGLTLTQWNRVRALVICRAPQAYAASRVREAAAYLLGMSGAAEDERRLASEAIEWLQRKRDEPEQAATKPRRKRRRRV